MRTNGDGSLTWAVETCRSNEIMEMHLFGESAPVEEALCGADTSAEERRSVSGYLEDRLNGIGVVSVCEGCKGRTIPFAQDRKAEGRLDEAEEYRRLAETLLKETGLDRSGD